MPRRSWATLGSAGHERIVTGLEEALRAVAERPSRGEPSKRARGALGWRREPGQGRQGPPPNPGP
jgi:hypothetical protein